MWLAVFCAVVVTGYFVLRRIVDPETSRNLAFLGKAALVILGLLLLLGLIILIREG